MHVDYLQRMMGACLQQTGTCYPAEHHDNALTPLEVAGLVPEVAIAPLIREAMYWEHEGNRAARLADRKFVKRGDAKAWEFDHHAENRTETKNPAESNQMQVRGMVVCRGERETRAKRIHVLVVPKNG